MELLKTLLLTLSITSFLVSLFPMFINVVKFVIYMTDDKCGKLIVTWHFYMWCVLMIWPLAYWIVLCH